MRIIWVWMIIFFAGGCGTTEKTTTESPVGYLASLYNPSKLSLHPDFSIFHENNVFSTLYIRAYPSELRFNQANEESEYRALISISYRLIKLDEDSFDGVVVDSSAITYKLLAKDEKRPAFFASIPIPAKSGNKYLLRLESTDLNRGSIGLEYMYVDKRTIYGAQNFKVVSLHSGYPKFMHFFMPGEKFNIRYRDPDRDSLFVDYFSLESELPRQPVNSAAGYTIPQKPDSSFVFPLNDTTNYDLKEEGMYFVRVDREQDEGLTLFNFGGTFPDVNTNTELMEPLFYLATLAEYRDLRMEPNRKLAVDNYWLKLGNSVEKSRELIRIYYNRVVYSNLYFTSNKEGWKSDRGMIFILFGPPNRIQMTGNGERWYYFARRKNRPIEFRFERRPDVFSLYHMDWVKTPESRSSWTEAVRSWRNGKVYSPGS